MFVLSDVEELRWEELVLAAEHFRLQDVVLASGQRFAARAHYQHWDVTFREVFLKVIRFDGIFIL